MGTWDGAPSAAGEVLPLHEAEPHVTTDVPDELQSLCKLGRDREPQTSGSSRFMQNGKLHFADEGAVAVSHNYSRTFQPNVERVLNCWNTFGPMCTPAAQKPMMNYTLTLREWYAATTGPPNTGWNAVAVAEGMTAALFSTDITFRTDANTTVQELRMATGQSAALYNNLDSLNLVFATSSTAKPITVEVLGNRTYRPSFCSADEMHEKRHCTATIERGGWFGAVSPNTSATQLYWNLGGPMNMSVKNARSTNEWLTLTDIGMAGKKIAPGANTFSWSLLSVAVDIQTNMQSVAQLIQLRELLASPEGLTIKRGTRVDHKHSLLELSPDTSYVAELAVPRPSNSSNPVAEALLLPLRVGPFNPRWTVGLFQLAGYTVGYYGTGVKRYTSLGLDDAGFAYIPLYAARAPLTHVAVGCPVTATGAGAEALFVQVTHVDENPQIWHVEINNPTEQAVTATFHASMALPGFAEINSEPVTIKAGGLIVL